MGIKYFCDECGIETGRNYVTERLKPERKDGTIRCEVIVTINGTCNSGVLCECCLRRTLLNDENIEKEGRKVKNDNIEIQKNKNKIHIIRDWFKDKLERRGMK